MKRGDTLIRALAVMALITSTAAVGCSNQKSDRVSGPAQGDRSAGKSGGDMHAGSGARYSGMSDSAPVDTKNTWKVNDEKLLPPSPLRGQAQPMPSKGGCIPSGYVVGSTAFPTGNPATSAILVEKGVPPQVVKGQDFDFVICATNLTDHDLNNVMISDVLSDGWVLKSSTPAYHEDLTARPDNVYIWDLNTISPGETRVINVRATPTTEGTITACATVQYESGVCVATNVVNPALQLVKTGTDAAGQCDEIKYTYRVTNSGTGAANGVVITDTLASGLTTQSGKGDVRIDVGTLAAGQTREFALIANAARPGKYSSKATATGEPSLRAESATVSTTVTKPSLKLTQECEDSEYIGRNADLSFTVQNTGDGTASGATLEATLPAGSTFVSATDGGRLVGNKITWSLGDIAAKASKKVAAVISATTSGSFQIASRASAACADPATASCGTEFRGIPAMLLEVVDLSDPVELGNSTTYVITATNQGSAPDSDIKITCVLDDSQSYVSSDGPTKASVQGLTITFSPLAKLGVGEKATWRVVVKAEKEDDARFTARMNTNMFKREPVQETESTTQYR